jgi:hypothetical protein
MMVKLMTRDDYTFQLMYCIIISFTFAANTIVWLQVQRRE